MLGPLLLPALTAAGVAGLSNGKRRDFDPQVFATSFYRPHEIEIDSLGLVNSESAYFATRRGVKRFLPAQDSFLHQVPFHLDDAEEISAFYLCHHRNSFFVETLAKDKGEVAIYEYVISAQLKLKVWSDEDAQPATSLACVDDYVLRSSPSSLVAVHLSTDPHKDSQTTELLHFHDASDPEVISWLAVGLAADTVSQARIYAVKAGTLVRLHIGWTGDDHSDPHHPKDSHLEVSKTELILSKGDAVDGHLPEASALELGRIAYARGGVLFSDGCSVRWLDLKEQKVQTLLGASCTTLTANETLAPVPWGSKLSPVPEGSHSLLVASSPDIEAMDVLVLTRAEVLRLSWGESSSCSDAHDEASCVGDSNKCGWAQGSVDDGETTCIQCSSFQAWADSLGHTDYCALLLGQQEGTRYSLSGCGCAEPSPDPEPNNSDGHSLSAGQVFLVLLVVAAAVAVGFLLFRAFRRANVMREMYGVDTAEFYAFQDEDCGYSR